MKKRIRIKEIKAEIKAIEEVVYLTHILYSDERAKLIKLKFQLNLLQSLKEEK